MKDKELDQILQHALTPTVSDEEIKVNYEMEGRPMMKKKNYFNTARRKKPRPWKKKQGGLKLKNIKKQDREFFLTPV